MRDDPMRQRIERFGELKFMRLLGLPVTGEAREVHNAYMDEWSFTDRSNPDFRRARRAERLRAVFLVSRRDRYAFLSLRAQSSIAVEPVAPDAREPTDVEDFLFDLQECFRSSTTQQLASIHTFEPVPNEGLERMFSRFNLIARPLESERPPSLTEDQITTHYLHHLEPVLSAKNFRDLERDLQKAERNREEDGRRHLNRHHIHDMALRQETENVVKQTRLHAAGIVSAPNVPMKDILTNKLTNRSGNQGKDKGQTSNPKQDDFRDLERSMQESDARFGAPTYGKGTTTAPPTSHP